VSGPNCRKSPPKLKVTGAVGGGPLATVTVTVKVIVCPTIAGFAEAVRTVVVAIFCAEAEDEVPIRNEMTPSANERNIRLTLRTED
jgi:hypothetical protein